MGLHSYLFSLQCVIPTENCFPKFLIDERKRECAMNFVIKKVHFKKDNLVQKLEAIN